MLKLISLLPVLSSLISPASASASSLIREGIGIDGFRGFEKLPLQSVVGPESLAFDRHGGGPYTGVSDGRILKWRGPGLGWTEFLPLMARRDNRCVNDEVQLESICGRPLGLQFNELTGDLYIADAYFGLLSVGPNGGPAATLATSAGWDRFRFTNGLDVDQRTGVVYFTDSSTRFDRSEYYMVVLTGDATGRLIRYDPRTKGLTVMSAGLRYPNGVALSNDGSFLLVAMTTDCRVDRYWLRGPRTGSCEVFAELSGYPDNIRRNTRGEFWVALSNEKIDRRRAPEMSMSLEIGEHPIAVRLDIKGRVLEVLSGGIETVISEVRENNGTLWFGSVDMPYVGVYKF